MRNLWKRALQDGQQGQGQYQHAFWVDLPPVKGNLSTVYEGLRSALEDLFACLPEHPPLSVGTVIALHCPFSPVENIDLLAWLCAYPTVNRLFWADRERNFLHAGLGNAISFMSCYPPSEFDELQSLLKDAPRKLRFFGGRDFNNDVDPKAPSHWEAMESTHWRLPQVSFAQEKGQYSLTLHLSLTGYLDLREQIDILRRSFAPLLQTPSILSPTLHKIPVSSRQDTPSFSQWCEAIHIAKEHFSQKSLEKVVLARETCLQVDQALPDPFALLHRLYQQAEGTYVFGFQADEHTTWWGASPERLYARNGKTLSSEALAGTRPRKEDPELDQHFGETLLASQKDRYEQLLVIRELEERFAGLCKDIQCPPEPQLRKFKHVQHLWTPIYGTLREETEDFSILEALHPTPAVGGRPREQALALLGELERFSRGWYAAPVGWIGSQGAEFCVGIRSALFSHDRLFLFTGAGIVPDSEPETEWRELEQKLKTFWEFVDCVPEFKPPT